MLAGLRVAWRLSGALATAGALAGCAATERPAAVAPAAMQDMAAAPTVPADRLAGKWGLGAFHRDSDRPRTEKEARAQCANPYVVGKGAHGGAMMHLADEKEPEELFLKTGGGKTYLGPSGPAPMLEDREVVAMDGNVMILKYMDKEVAARYGTAIYVRCGA